MTSSVDLSPRFRVRAAVVLLLVTAVFIAVAWSQLFFGAGNDPRDTLGSRAAGFGFTDHAHDTLYSAIPLALPLVAALSTTHGGVRLVAVVEYGVLIVTGALITGAAFVFGLDVAEQQRAGFDTVFVDTRSTVEALLLDLGLLTLAVVAMLGCLRAWLRGRAA